MSSKCVQGGGTLSSRTLDRSAKKWCDPGCCQAIEESENWDRELRSVTENCGEIDKCTRATIRMLSSKKDCMRGKGKKKEDYWFKLSMEMERKLGM